MKGCLLFEELMSFTIAVNFLRVSFLFCFNLELLMLGTNCSNYDLFLIKIIMDFHIKINYITKGLSQKLADCGSPAICAADTMKKGRRKSRTTAFWSSKGTQGRNAMRRRAVSAA